MSAPTGDGSQPEVTASSRKSEGKQKRAKSEHKKKRAREEDHAAAVEETPRKLKKTKNESGHEDDQAPQTSQSLILMEESPKKKKKRHNTNPDTSSQDQVAVDPGQSSADGMELDSTREVAEENTGHESHKRKKEKKEKKSKKHQVPEHEPSIAQEDPVQADTATATIPPDEGVKERKKRKSKDKPKADSRTDAAVLSQESQPGREVIPEFHTDPDFPFFMQSISLYVPFFPVGFDKPLTNVAAQHLDPLLNHYSPLLRGVLLGYSNLNLSDRPAKASIRHPPTDQTPALLHSIDEYAVGFGWLTFDAHLFVPARGKWMEGILQLQSEGHIGVVCWNKFNASIEAKRLPKGWRWVELDPKQNDLDGEELQVVEQIHTTGYWVNERGRKVSGKLRFRIKNFDVGLAGDYGYLSIEGTFLNDDEERALAAQERELERARRAKQNPNGLLRPLSRRVPEFSMTKFGREDEEEDGGQRTVLYKGSRPVTPDD
ncbi:hypothetical protein N656DRAFT_751452 [Canariomyces notabilis]|uniref:DNA-directed RNA polymerase subunit n=1 Tax=Canariomyces notabilis TaxID=2074819 RepID=A0AAN6YTK2_9PEZI|nr:hypothetical protein N656DRAFT_751452 [Canariomyces arenarius]